MNTSHYDFIIVGSGFGGAVAAHKLVQSGARVLLLERGPWRDTQPVQGQGIRTGKPLPAGRHFFTHLVRSLSLPLLPAHGITLNRHGLYDIHHARDMTLICTSGVGGGSHAYSAMNTRPEVENYWEKALGNNAAEEMEKHYDWMLQVMGAHAPSAEERIPNFTGEQFRDSPHFVADASIDQPAMAIQRDPRLNPYKDASFFGSQTGAKTTLDVALITPAMAQGLTVLAEHECLTVNRRQHQNDYRLDVYDHASQRYRFFTADKILLAAGTLNTLKLLYRSRDTGGLQGMPALGQGFGGNGDFPALWLRDTGQADMTLGTPCHGRFALRDYGECPNLTSYGLNGLDQIPLPAWLKKRLRKLSFVISMGADAANGHLGWHRGRLQVHYNRYQQPILKRIADAFDEIARRSQKPVRYSSDHLMTVHPLGGARCGTTVRDSVVNLQGEVHDHPGLFIVDASALPSAPGSPPSMTVAAWSAHVCDAIQANRQQARQHHHRTQESSQ